MSELIIEESIVSVDWLQLNVNAPNLIILDATIPKITQGKTSSSEEEQIPNSIFFDIKNKFSAIHSPFPNTCPSQEQFTNEAQKLGINNDSAIVIYDAKGIYSDSCSS